MYRADIAEQLHDIMETQWQRALEMISTGNPNDDTVDRNQSAKKNQNQRKAEEVYETPVNNRQNSKSVDGGQTGGDDKLQSFIDLVIS